MAKQHSMSGERLHQINNTNPSEETPWQQLMVFNYLILETVDALEREQASGQPTPLNDHWQGFIHHLRQHKPRLGPCLDNLLREVFLPQGGQQ